MLNDTFTFLSIIKKAPYDLDLWKTKKGQGTVQDKEGSKEHHKGASCAYAQIVCLPTTRGHQAIHLMDRVLWSIIIRVPLNVQRRGIQFSVTLTPLLLRWALLHKYLLDLVDGALISQEKRDSSTITFPTMKNTLSFVVLDVLVILAASPAQSETPCETACMKKVKANYHECVAANYQDRACKPVARIRYKKCGTTCLQE